MKQKECLQVWLGAGARFDAVRACSWFQQMAEEPGFSAKVLRCMTAYNAVSHNGA